VTPLAVPGLPLAYRGPGWWGKLLGDTAAVTALLDRLLHHAHVLNFRRWRRSRSRASHAPKLIGGTTGKPNIGVVFDVLEPTELLAAFMPDGQPF
jgi:IstB-like ATP binding protein